MNYCHFVPTHHFGEYLNRAQSKVGHHSFVVLVKEKQVLTMEHKGVNLLWMLVGVLFLLTVVTSKPVSLNTAADESDSVEANSSEEAVTEEAEEVEEPELPETEPPATEPPATEAPATEALATEPPNVVISTDPPATVALPVLIDTTALPSDTADPQTSTDGLQMLPEDPSPASVGMDVSQDMPETDPAHDPLAPGVDVAVEVGIPTEVPQQQINDVQHEVLPTLYPPYVKGKSTHVSVVNAVPVHLNDPGVPVCFTFHTQQYHTQHYAAPQYNPPRGDNY